jgi:hypothetical protein
MTNRTTQAISVTINKQTKQVTDCLLTPAGFFEPPKGAYSQLINGLLNGYMESTLNTDMFSIMEFCNENPGYTVETLKEHFRNA